MFFRCFLTCTALCLSIPVVYGQAPAQTALQRQYDHMDAAERNLNVSGYLSHHTADYSETFRDGRPAIHGRRQDRGAAIQNIQWIHHWNHTETLSFHHRDAIQTITVHGNMADVTVETRSSIQPSLRETNHDIWRQIAGRWLLARRVHGQYRILDAVPAGHASGQSSPSLMSDR